MIDLADIRSATSEKLLGYLNSSERANAPEVLWYAGHPELLSQLPRVSIVGSRTASAEALRRAAKLAAQLVAHGVTIVSGLARGIDGAAHRSAIENGGRTIAVIGTPLDRAYPPEHAELQWLIAREHLLVSQFPVGHPVSRSNFPRRNRTMALLSHATVIVEAGETSGTLSQGWEALRLGRPLFIMRSVAEDQRLKWPRKMLDYGGLVLSEAEEVRESLPPPGGGAYATAPF